MDTQPRPTGGPTEGEAGPAVPEETDRKGVDRPETSGKPAAWWTATSTSASGGVGRLPVVRLAWAVAVAVVALIVWGASGPGGSSDWEDEIRSASSMADINNASAEGAPQQTVVNGWHQVDLAETQIRQGADLLARQAQTSNLLLVLVVGLMGDLAIRALGDRDAALRRQRRAGGVLGI